MARVSPNLLIVAVCVCFAGTAYALPPGYTAGRCEAVPHGEMFIEFITPPQADSYTPISQFGAMESASFGRFLLTTSRDVEPDTMIHIEKYNATSGAHERYEPQPGLQVMFGDACEYIAFGDAGVGVCSAGNSVKFLYYNTATALFSATGFIDVTKDFTRCYIKGAYAFVYDNVAQEFNVYRHTGNGNFVDLNNPLPAVSSAMAISRASHELAIVATTGTIQFYNSLILPSYDISPSGYRPGDIADMLYDHANNLVVGLPVTSSIYLHERDAASFITSAIAQTFPFVGFTQGYRLTANDASAGFVISTAPVSEPFDDISRGSVIVFRSPQRGQPFVYWLDYFMEFSGTGAHTNLVGLAGDPQMAFFNDPFESTSGYPDRPDGAVAVLCLEDEDCNGSCGRQCDLDDNPCTEDVWNGEECVYVRDAAVDDGDPYTMDVCDPNVGIMHFPTLHPLA